MGVSCLGRLSAEASKCRAVARGAAGEVISNA